LFKILILAWDYREEGLLAPATARLRSPVLQICSGGRAGGNWINYAAQRIRALETTQGTDVGA
jgi:hypothetical protein